MDMRASAATVTTTLRHALMLRAVPVGNEEMVDDVAGADDEEVVVGELVGVHSLTV